MFGTPERVNNKDGAHFYVPLAKPTLLNLRINAAGDGKLQPELSFRGAFITLQNTVLRALLENKQLFKNPPTLESLEAITPNWGVIVKDSGIDWNPYTKIKSPEFDAEMLPAVVDLQLDGLTISRSTIMPNFRPVFIGKVQAPEIIDFEWSPAAAATLKDMEEVSDIPSAVIGSITLKNPAVILREKLAKKAEIRAALVAAEVARENAMKMAEKYYADYDISDNESAFSEWMSDSDSESVS